METSSTATFEAGNDLLATLPPDRVHQLLKLQKAAQKINSILDLDQLIDKIVNDIACSFGCINISVYLHEPENSEMVLAGVRSCPTHRKDTAEGRQGRARRLRCGHRADAIRTGRKRRPVLHLVRE